MLEITRRGLLKRTLLAGGAFAASAILAACGATPPTPAKPAEAPKPTEAPKAAEAPKPSPQTGAQAAPAPPTPVPATRQLLKAPEPNPKRGGTLKTAFGVTVGHYDFHQGGGGPLVHAFDNLVMLNPQDGFKTIVPELAESWELSSDGKSYTFKVRDGVKFHDGTPFSAEDVVATYNRIVFPPKGMASGFRENFSAVDRIELVDRLTMRFILKYPWRPFLSALTGVNMVIYSKKHLEENNYDMRKVIAPGTGAFLYKEYRQAERWIFERNPNYWNPELPYVDRLELLHVPAWTDRGTAVLTGQADFSWNVSMETHEEGKKRSDIVNVRVLPHFGAAYLFQINNQRKPFNDPRVRRAIHLAVSRQNLIKAFATQEFITMDRWVSHANDYAMPFEELEKLPGYRPDKQEDVAEAKRLMAEAGYPDGFEAELMSADVAPHQQIMAPAIQDELKRTLNIRTKIRTAERALLSESLGRGDYDLQLSTDYGSDVADPELMWSLQLKTGASRNWSKYSNPKIDKILDQLQTTTDDPSRQRLVRDAMEILDQDPPFYLMGFADHLPMWRKPVKGIVANWRHTLWGRFQTVWLDK
jgi:peptide/nickel transport system substrate-binding protein